MPDQLHARAKENFLEVCERPRDQRDSLLDRACGDNQELRREVQSLLAYHSMTQEESVPAFHGSDATSERQPGVARAADDDLGYLTREDRLLRLAVVKGRALRIDADDVPSLVGLGQTCLRRAEWVMGNARGTDAKGRVTADIVRGLEYAAKALSINPRAAEAVGVRGALLLMQARLELDGKARAENARRARAALEEAVQMNRLLGRRYQPLIEEARQLLGFP